MMILYANETILMTSGTDIEEVKSTLTSAQSIKMSSLVFEQQTCNA